MNPTFYGTWGFSLCRLVRLASACFSLLAGGPLPRPPGVLPILDLVEREALPVPCTRDASARPMAIDFISEGADMSEAAAPGKDEVLRTDVVIIGAGPVGLFAAF